MDSSKEWAKSPLLENSKNFEENTGVKWNVIEQNEIKSPRREETEHNVME